MESTFNDASYRLIDYGALGLFILFLILAIIAGVWIYFKWVIPRADRLRSVEEKREDARYQSLINAIKEGNSTTVETLKKIEERDLEEKRERYQKVDAFLQKFDHTVQDLATEIHDTNERMNRLELEHYQHRQKIEQNEFRIEEIQKRLP